MIECAIIDRTAHLPAKVDWLQVRDKSLPVRELLALTRAALATPAKVIVNTRCDVALAADAHGLHLPAGSPPPSRFAAIAPAGFLIGVSCHTLAEVIAAEEEGASYVVFGPIFTPLSKSSDLPPRGLVGLERAATAVRIPVLALGGVTRERVSACVNAGAAGIAGISLFRS
jgi:thiamine-phosphate pyrophosphorylase